MDEIETWLDPKIPIEYVVGSFLILCLAVLVGFIFKVMKRNAYGFRDEKYFTLRLYALHDCRITRNVG